VIKGCNVFLVKKLAKLAALWAGALLCNKKNLERRTQLDERADCASGVDSLFLYKILHLLFFPLVRILCTLRPESRKNYQHGLDAGTLKFQFLRPRGCLTNPSRTLSLCFGVISKTPDFISRKNVVKKFCLRRPS